MASEAIEGWGGAGSAFASSRIMAAAGAGARERGCLTIEAIESAEGIERAENAEGRLASIEYRAWLLEEQGMGAEQAWRQAIAERDGGAS